MTLPTEPVVLVTEKNEPVGLMEKADVHSAHTPLHRGFSIFLFRQDGSVLLQRRSLGKKLWPGAWSNSCCGHPLPDEAPAQAAARRLEHELGICLPAGDIITVDNNFTYRVEQNGVVEHEICPVMVARYDDEVAPSPGEVEEVRWESWATFLSSVRESPDEYTPWCVEEAEIIAPRLHELLTF